MTGHGLMLVMFIIVQGSTVVKNVVVLDHGKDWDIEKIIGNILFIVVLGAAGGGLEEEMVNESVFKLFW